MFTNLTRLPYTELLYLQEIQYKLTQETYVRTDRIQGGYTAKDAAKNVFSDYVSCYSPLTSKIGDLYLIVPTYVQETFFLK